MGYVGIQTPAEFRTVTRAHVLAWRKSLEEWKLSGATIRRKLAALSSLYQYLCNAHAVPMNPVKGVARPKIEGYQGKTPALSDAQVRHLLAAPKGDGVKAKRDRAILSTLFYHALRRAELCTLTVRDMTERRGVKHFRVHGKGEKLRYVPIHRRRWTRSRSIWTRPATATRAPLPSSTRSAPTSPRTSTGRCSRQASTG